jgi:signal transduction histidine kinase
MSSATGDRPAGVSRAPGRVWRTLGARLALWYVAVTLLSYVALAAIVPLTVRAWVDDEGQKTTQGALERYRQALEIGGTDALRSLFACDVPTEASFTLRLRDKANVELYRVSSDEASDQVGRVLTRDGGDGKGKARLPSGWHVASVAVSQDRQLEMVRQDDAGLRSWGRVRELSLLILLSGLLSAIVGALVITRRSLRPVVDLATASQQIIDSGDLTLRVATRGTADNLDQLAGLFNRMLARNEALVRAMRESLDNVAHDLRTPLTRLRAGAELALTGANGAPRAEDALAGAIEESDRVLSMLTTLMDITGAETGAMRLDRKPEDLADIARESVELYDFVATERGVHLVTRLTANVRVNVDRARVRQVCANLIDNAIKYTPAGGHLEVSVTADGDKGILAVTDNGVGIPTTDLPRVWDRLYRGDHSRAEHGLGLGLSLVKAVVEAHGGTVSVKSEPGVGSTFEVRLELAKAGSSQAAQPAGNDAGSWR